MFKKKGQSLGLNIPTRGCGDCWLPTAVLACGSRSEVREYSGRVSYYVHWASKAWKVYLRENWSQISDQTIAVFNAAFVKEQLPSVDTHTPPLLDEDVDDGN